MYKGGNYYCSVNRWKLFCCKEIKAYFAKLWTSILGNAIHLIFLVQYKEGGLNKTQYIFNGLTLKVSFVQN